MTIGQDKLIILASSVDYHSYQSIELKAYECKSRKIGD